MGNSCFAAFVFDFRARLARDGRAVPSHDCGNRCFSLHPASGQLSLTNGMECAAGLLLCAGLWTPIAGAVLAAVVVWSVVSTNGDPWPQMLVAGMAIALALLGPGAWSIDARLFGRKRLIREP